MYRRRCSGVLEEAERRVETVKGTNKDGEENGIGERKEQENNGIIDKAKFFSRERKGRGGKKKEYL